MSVRPAAAACAAALPPTALVCGTAYPSPFVPLRLHHRIIKGAEQLWHDRLTGADEATGVGALYELAGAAMCTAWEERVGDASVLHAQLLEQCDAWVLLARDASDDWLLTTATYEDTEGVATSVVRIAALTQVFNHGTHHRGQVSAAFSRLGVPCPSFDLQQLGDAFLEYDPARIS